MPDKYYEAPVSMNERNFVVCPDGYCVHPSFLAEFDDKLEWFVVEDLFSALTCGGIFSSRSQAKKNWQGPKELQNGFNWFERIGQKRLSIVIYKCHSESP